MSRWTVFVFAALFTGLLVVHAVQYLPFLSDDALISLRYAQRLLEGEGLTWTEGPRVEGYSNLLWVLAAAGLGALGMDLVHAARLLGFLGMSGVIVGIVRHYASRDSVLEVGVPLAIGLLFFVLSTPIAVWTIGGLEQPLFALLLAWAIPATFAVVEVENPSTAVVLRASLPFGLLCLTRPDAPLYAAGAVLSVFACVPRSAWRSKIRTALHLGSLPLLFTTVQLAFRAAYYGELVPNTALAKIAFTWSRLEHGTRYVGMGILALAPFSFLGIAELVRASFSSQPRRARVLLSMLVPVLAYLAVIGGDLFPARRRFVPVIVVLTFALIEGAGRAARFLAPRPVVSMRLAGAGLAAALLAFVFAQVRDPANRRAVVERWEWDGKVVALLLQTAFAEQRPLVAVTAAGCIPFWSELPAVDMLGLNDSFLARNPPEDFGQGRSGHELGDADYVLERRPDIVVFFTGALEGRLRVDRELLKKREFVEGYVPVHLQGTRPHAFKSGVWIRRASERIGIVTAPNEIRVPAYLLEGKDETVAHLDEEGRLVVTVSPGAPMSTVLEVPAPGNWQAEVLAAPASGIHCLAERCGDRVRATLTARGLEPAVVRELVLRRVPAPEPPKPRRVANRTPRPNPPVTSRAPRTASCSTPETRHS